MNPVPLYQLVLYFLGVALYGIAIVIGVFGVLRLQLKFILVRNGLATFRKQLLFKNMTFITVGIVSEFLLSGLTFFRQYMTVEQIRLMNVLLIFISAIFFLGSMLLELIIQHTQFTPEQIEFHHKIADLEDKRQARDDRREIARVKLNKDRRAETARKRNVS